MKLRIQILFVLVALVAGVHQAASQGTAFSYQGSLNDGGNPASGIYDVEFTLYATNIMGDVIAGPVTNNATVVSNGLFSASVDFGPNVFTGSNYWLDLAVRTNGANIFSELTPRQAIAPTPYAIFANTASNVSGTISPNQLSGPIPAAQLPASVLTNGASGVSISGTFTGNGSGLTNVSGPTKTYWSYQTPGNGSLNYTGSGATYFQGGLQFIPGATNVISQAGTYLVQYNAEAECTSGTSQWVQIVPIISGVPQTSTVTFLPNINQIYSLSGSFIINLPSGTNSLSFNFNASSSSVYLESVSYNNYYFSASYVRIQ
jgi:hypothetical protein